MLLFQAVSPPSAKKKALAKLQGLLGVNPLVEESPNNLGATIKSI